MIYNRYIELFWLYVLKISFRLAAFVVMMNAAFFDRYPYISRHGESASNGFVADSQPCRN